MFTAIVQHTPAWVWGLLAALTALGLWQTRPRAMSLSRVTVLPLVLMGLSLTGVITAFGHLPIALVAWAAGAAAAVGLGRQALAVRGASWSASKRLLQVPGSGLPLVLILALFTLKYGAGVSLALFPTLASDSTFAAGCSFAYGVFSGLFLARALSLRSLATRPSTMLAA
jgi:hypothetical protein